MAFKCDAGKWLSVEETADMLAYEENGLRRPAEYNDVVFDNTSGQRGGYRCKTDAEAKRVNDIANAEKDAAKVAEARRVRVLNQAGIDAATGVVTRPAAFNTNLDLADAVEDEGQLVTAGGVAPALFEDEAKGKAKDK